MPGGEDAQDAHPLLPRFTGIPLGMLEEAGWEEGPSLALESGDVVLIGTDGIWESRNSAGETFGTRRLCDRLRACAPEPASAIHAAIMAEVRSFRGEGRQEDDLTLVVVKAV